MSERFYVNWPLEIGPTQLEGPEAHHLATVCRLRQGDAVTLFNGDGHEYPARVIFTQKKQIELEILERLTPERELSPPLDVAVAVPKGDRVQFLVEKLTELGVRRFTPLATRRSVVHPREAKLEKLERYVVEASKQCRRNLLMTIGELENWTSYSRREDLPKQRWLAHPGGQPAAELLAQRRQTPEPVVVAIGPEGGFDDAEVAEAKAHGWSLVDLGPRILRIETAAIALASLVGVG